MTPQRTLTWKIGYVLAMIPLLMALFWLARPATPETKNRKGSPGGVLVQLRDRHGLAQTKLGEIDPASETMKLATLGMRGIAVNILWTKANRYYMKKDWTNLSATVQQLAKLQPHFISAWRFQCWNLSYNVSVQFDDYRDRYHWVMRGIDFLGEGIRHNQNEAVLVWDSGWFTSQKIGRSDERVQFRQLFKQDDDFHDRLPFYAQDPTRDSWQVGKRWFRRVEELVDGGARMRGTSPVVYFSDASMCQLNYADAIEVEGTFGEVARRAWRQASDEWREFGFREIPTAYGMPLRLSDLDDGVNYERIARERHEQLRRLVPALTDRLDAERQAVLTKAQREALDTPGEKRTPEQHRLAGEAENILKLTNQDIARRMKGPKRDEAMRLAEEGDRAEELCTYIRRYRDIVNFDYWRERAEMEQKPDCVGARERIYRGQQAYDEGDLLGARAAYAEGFALWRKVLDQHPNMAKNPVTGANLMDVIRDYERLRRQLDEPLDLQTFILKDIVETHGGNR